MPLGHIDVSNLWLVVSSYRASKVVHFSSPMNFLFSHLAYMCVRIYEAGQGCLGPIPKWGWDCRIVKLFRRAYSNLRTPGIFGSLSFRIEQTRLEQLQIQLRSTAGVTPSLTRTRVISSASASTHPICLAIWNIIWTNYCPSMKQKVWENIWPKYLAS